MKKFLLMLPVCVVLLAAVWAVAAGGGAGDPLATLSYLQGDFTRAVDAKVEEKLDKAERSGAESDGDGSAALWTERRMKSGDVLTGEPGASVLLLAGSAQVTYSSGAVVDVTTGTEVPSGAALAANHRYIVAEDTSAWFTVTSKTAVVDFQGGYGFQPSAAVDYNAMAAALKTLHLFRGSATGYGQGFDLEIAPTRLQAIIMFIRVLGEEEQALAWSGTTPFTDIVKGSLAEKYVGYAYEQGYTNGYGTQFKPTKTVNAYQYTEFLLRAMGYSSTANTNLADTLERAVASGVLTFGEAEALKQGTFLRADLVYVSYYALEAPLPDGSETLGEQLRDKGVFTKREWREARDLVPGWRM